MKITKRFTRKYEVYDCAEWMSTFGDTISYRKTLGLNNKGLSKCFICGKKFNDDEYPYLAAVKNHKNVFICKDCAKEVKSNDIYRK